MTEWGGESDRGGLEMFDVISGLYPVKLILMELQSRRVESRDEKYTCGVSRQGVVWCHASQQGGSLRRSEHLQVFITFTTFPPHRQSHFCCSGWHHHHNYSKRLANKEVPAMMCRNNMQFNVYILNQCIDLHWNFKDQPPITIHWSTDALLSWSPTALR